MTEPAVQAGCLPLHRIVLQTLAKRRGKEVAIHLFGQEINPETYAICTADMLLKGDGEEAEHIMYGSTLSMISTLHVSLILCFQIPRMARAGKLMLKKWVEKGYS
jgi:hypothetical protein